MTIPRGISLVEMMVAVVVLGVISSLTIELLLTMFHANSSQQEETAAEFSWQQLEVSLRDDVHAAQHAELDDNRLVLTLPEGQQVVYTALAQSVSKERMRDNDLDNDSAQQITHRERFALPRGLALHWQKKRESERDWLIVDLRPHDPNSSQARKQPRVLRDVHLQICIGRGQGGSP